MKSANQSADLTKSACRIYKIIVIGDPNVGKTCLTYRFTEGKFPNSTEATIGVDFREKVIEINHELIRLQLWDTAGQERFRKSMVPHYYRNVHAVVFVFDVTRRDSFEHLSEWIQECEKYNLANSVHRIIIGNKCDLDGKRVISDSEALKFADEHRLPLFETSAKKDSSANHVEGIFLTLVHRMHSSKAMILSTVPNEVVDLSQSNYSDPIVSNSCQC